MHPTLHTRLPRCAALAAFGGNASAPTFCGGDFVKLDGAVLLFATLSGPARTRLETADRLIWCPICVTEALEGANDAHPWLPSAIRECFDRADKRSFEHYAFVRQPQDGDNWLYCGHAHLGSWSTDGDDRCEASFSFEDGRLGRDDWRALQGWTGWHVIIDDQTFDGGGDQTGVFAAQIERVAATELVEIMLHAPTGEVFTCHLNKHRAALSYIPGTGEPWTLGLRDPHEKGQEEEVFFDTLGPCEMPMPRSRTLPREIATRALVQIAAHQRSPREGEEVCIDSFEARWIDW